MTYENAALTWVRGLLLADGTLTGLIPGGVHRGVAPEQTPRPLVTLSHRGGAPTNAAGCLATQEVILAIAIQSVDGDQDVGSEAAAARVEEILSHAKGTSEGLRFRCIPSGTLPDIPAPAEGMRYFRSQGRLWRVLVSPAT